MAGDRHPHGWKQVTVRLSGQKVSLILGYLLRGWPQPAVAGKLGVDQSTVSLWFSRFKARAKRASISQAGKEFGVTNDVDSLRSLAAELFQNQLSVKDARDGMKVVLAFSALGVPLHRHKDLVQVCKKVQEPAFVAAALKLCELEAETGMTYKEALVRFKETGSKVQSLQGEKAQLSSQLAGLNSKVAGRKRDLYALEAKSAQRKKELAEEEQEMAKELRKSMEAELSSQLAGLNNKVAGRKEELKAVEAKLAQRKKELAEEEQKMAEKLRKRMEQVEVTAQEVETVSRLKAELAERGLDLEVLMSLAKEFQRVQ